MTEASGAAPDGASGGKPIRLPVWRLLAVSFASVFSHPGNFIRRAWMWIAIVVSVGFIFVSLASITMIGWLIVTMHLILPVIYTIAGLWFALGWHRGLLLQEPADWLGGVRFDRMCWRFFVCGIVVAPWYALVFFFAHFFGQILFKGLLGVHDPQQPIVQITLNTIGNIVALPVAARILIAFPIVAVQNDPSAIFHSWAATAGNTWRLFILLLVTHLAIQTISVVAHAAVGAMLGSVGLLSPMQAVAMATGVIFVFISFAITASLASYSYAILTGHPLAKEVAR